METRDDWALAIGKALLAFGDIEFLVVEGIDKLSPLARSKKSIWKLKLAPRLDELSAIAAKMDGAVADDLQTLLAQVQVLAKSRNLIAHNPLRLDVYYSEKADEYWFEMVISCPRNETRRLKLADVENLADRSKEIAVSLADTLAKIPTK